MADVPATTLTWWGCAGIELHFDDTIVAIDPYLHPEEPRCSYIFCSHEHYDHCHEPTLRRLCQGPAFRRLVVSPGCLHMSELQSPVNASPSDLSFVDPARLTALYPLHAKEARPSWEGPTALALGRLRVEGVESSEMPELYRSGAPVNGALPTTGYLLEDLKTGLSFYHPGDIHEAFTALRNLRGRVTYMFYPLGKFDEAESEIAIVDLVRPRFLIPVHHRFADPDFPIPLHLPPEVAGIVDLRTGASLPGVSREQRRPYMELMMPGHWYPTPADPVAEVKRLQERLGDLAQFRLLKAGMPYALPLA